MLDNSENNYLAKKELFKGVKNLTIVTPSEWLASKVSSSFLNEYSIKVINNGVNLSVFKPSESELRYIHDIERKFIILGVAGSWEERKGFDIFKKLSNLLSKDEAILLVGVTEKQKASLPINIIGITKTNNVGDLARFYSAADVFVNPTLEDNFPTTNLESLACGTPVITFNTGGSAESVDESCGLIVDHGNLEELLEKVRYVKMLGKSTYSQNAIDRAWKFYHDKNRYQDYIDIYDNIY